LDAFRQGASSERAAVRAVSLAALIAQGSAQNAWQLAVRSPAAQQDFLTAVMLVPDRATRENLREQVLECLSEDQPMAVRRAAIVTLATLPKEAEANFRLVAPLLGVKALRPAAVQTLLQIPKEARRTAEATPVVERLVKLAEQTPVAERTTPEFLDAMQLTDELLAVLPTANARTYRARLRDVVVRVVRIQTIHEEMRYDTPYFAVEAGRPVQLVLRNVDLMPHNLVITQPGMLRTVAQQATSLPPTIDAQGRQYVPSTPEVLQATRMVPAGSQDVLTFTAPTEPGAYPYVCTFPNHWMRMYGVMVVVPDLDAWLANPSIPADPLGITRAFVKNWTVTDFDDLTDGLKGRTAAVGERLFKEATCLQCHKVGAQGGAVGPELTRVFQRHQQDAQAVLRELLDPSHKVAPEYAVTNILTTDGRVISGIVKAQDPESITVISNPENPLPVVISRDDIEEMVKSSTSLMPKGLLDRYTQDEVLEILAYLQSTEP
jgi:putative heme-binding domain-containing protein